jgi:hypothetical protein
MVTSLLVGPLATKHEGCRAGRRDRTTNLGAAVSRPYNHGSNSTVAQRSAEDVL